MSTPPRLESPWLIALLAVGGMVIWAAVSSHTTGPMGPVSGGSVVCISAIRAQRWVAGSGVERQRTEPVRRLHHVCLRETSCRE
jgi:hypothetical protein